MRQLVVLVGLPGSGKTAFCREQQEWIVLSKNDIHRMIFRSTFSPEYADAAERIFASALVEAVESQAEIVCVDSPNLTRGERASLIEIGRLAGRETIAHVMNSATVDALHDRTGRNLRRLTMEDPTLRVVRFPRRDFETLAATYEPVATAEGFARVIYEESAAPPTTRSATDKSRARHTRVDSRDPLPLFVS